MSLNAVISRKLWFLSCVWAITLMIIIETWFADTAKNILCWLATKSERPEPWLFPWLIGWRHRDCEWRPNISVWLTANWVGSQCARNIIQKLIGGVAPIVPLKSWRTFLVTKVVARPSFLIAIRLIAMRCGLIVIQICSISKRLIQEETMEDRWYFWVLDNIDLLIDWLLWIFRVLFPRLLLLLLEKLLDIIWEKSIDSVKLSLIKLKLL